MGVANRARQGCRVDLTPEAVELSACRRRKLPVSAPNGAFIVLHADEVVLSRGVEPGAVELLADRIAPLFPAGSRLIIDNGKADPDRQVRACALDRRPAGLVP